MGKKLYVGNLTYDVTSSDLEQLFAAHGTVESAEVIADRMSGRSKGFGFVEMSSPQEAQAAIDALNGKDHGGRVLTVNEARPRESRQVAAAVVAAAVVVAAVATAVAVAAAATVVAAAVAVVATKPAPTGPST
jgi:cold-inducible RNA-binding protein